MALLTSIVEGWTDAVPFTLRADDVAVNLTGLTVVGVFHDNRGAALDTTGKISVTGTTAGLVAWAPAAGDALQAKSPYRIRFKVSDIAGAIVYFPNVDPDTITVHKP